MESTRCFVSVTPVQNLTLDPGESVHTNHSELRKNPINCSGSAQVSRRGSQSDCSVSSFVLFSRWSG